MLAIVPVPLTGGRAHDLGGDGRQSSRPCSCRSSRPAAPTIVTTAMPGGACASGYTRRTFRLDTRPRWQSSRPSSRPARRSTFTQRGGAHGPGTSEPCPAELVADFHSRHLRLRPTELASTPMTAAMELATGEVELMAVPAADAHDAIFSGSGLLSLP